MDETARIKEKFHKYSIAKTIDWGNGWKLQLAPIEELVNKEKEDDPGFLPSETHFIGRLVSPNSQCVYYCDATHLGDPNGEKSGWIPHCVHVYLDKPSDARFKEEYDYPFQDKKNGWESERKRLYSYLHSYTDDHRRYTDKW